MKGVTVADCVARGVGFCESTVGRGVIEEGLARGYRVCEESLDTLRALFLKYVCDILRKSK